MIIDYSNFQNVFETIAISPNIDVRGLPLNMFWGAVYGVKAPRGYARLRGATSFIRAHLPGAGWGETWRRRLGNKMVISSNFSKAPLEWCRWMWTASWRWWGAFLPWPKRRRKRERIWWREVKSQVWWEWWQLWQIRPQKERLLEQGQVRGQGRFIFQIDQQTSLQCWRRRGERPPKCRQQCRTQIKGAVQENERLVSKRRRQNDEATSNRKNIAINGW